MHAMCVLHVVSACMLCVCCMSHGTFGCRVSHYTEYRSSQPGALGGRRTAECRDTLCVCPPGYSRVLQGYSRVLQGYCGVLWGYSRVLQGYSRVRQGTPCTRVHLQERGRLRAAEQMASTIPFEHDPYGCKSAPFPPAAARPTHSTMRCDAMRCQPCSARCLPRRKSANRQRHAPIYSARGSWVLVSAACGRVRADTLQSIQR